MKWIAGKHSRSANSVSETLRARLERWYRTHGAGERLREQLMADMRVILDEWFGYHMLVIGVDADIPIGSMTRVQHITRVTPDCTRYQGRETCVVALDEDLPIETESVDVVVVINALELSDSPHQLLREVHRVLTPHGHLLIAGNNSRSPGGWWRRLMRWTPGSDRGAGSGPGLSQLEDWLRLLDFSIAKPRHKLVIPARGKGRVGRWLARVDNWLVEHNIPLGSAYVLFADKMVRGYVQPQQVERTSARLIGLPVAKPVVGARGSASRNADNPLRPVK